MFGQPDDDDLEQPMEIMRPRSGRVVRCPSCGHYFQSLRGWRQTCPDCGHTWGTFPAPDIEDRVRAWVDEGASGLLIVLMWVMFVAMIVGAVVLAGSLVLVLSRGGGVLPAVMIGLTVLVLMLVVGRRPRR